MGDPLSVSASLVALTGFAFQASKSLYQAVDSFKSSKRAVRELREEVESLNGVLENLSQMAVEYDAQLTSLKLPLVQCAKTCEEFERVISKCVGHSDGQRTSFRDWAQLQYRGGGMENLKTTLAGYKSTISIAIGGATFRQVVVTANVLDDYQKMIEEATSDLQEHLQLIDKRMQSLMQNSASIQANRPPEVEEIVEEKRSIRQCLAICTQVSQLIEAYQTRRIIYQTPGGVGSQKQSATFGAETATNDLLMGFRTRLSSNTKNLQDRLQELENRLGKLSENGDDQQHLNLLQAMKEERDSISHCLEICTEASDLTATVRTNVYEEVKSADNSHQLVVSTIGDLISAKHITTGSNSVQWLGQMSDETIQKLSSDNKRAFFENQTNKTQEQKDVFHDLYGEGRQLKGDVGPTGGK
ncbi:hypothetical protein TMatcc_000723 [Talaromyces marneffei ATCC 18224]|uniref:Azaphilone pigments biosynthesis cluster protein L N-terminal domain-containing protein n=3 Tax=Talaromyces marneffei TaxID=37727 RepID=B6QR04_TALMQ|nr:conserved hypothetical protein [Talaromyces marneffei ATCC 18224]